jgi:predicted RNA-binding protein YlqC (UPF0109 family)
VAAPRSAADLVEFMARAMVSRPDAVAVREVETGRALELETADEDRGRVIGRQGRVAKALRAILADRRLGARPTSSCGSFLPGPDSRGGAGFARALRG